MRVLRFLERLVLDLLTWVGTIVVLILFGIFTGVYALLQNPLSEIFGYFKDAWSTSSK